MELVRCSSREALWKLVSFSCMVIQIINTTVIAEQSSRQFCKADDSCFLMKKRVESRQQLLWFILFIISSHDCPPSISVTPADPGYLRNKYHRSHLHFASYVEVWEFLAHDSLPAFLANFAVDKPQNAVVHIQWALALEGVPSSIFFDRTEDGFLTLLWVLEFELGKKLLGLHWPGL